MRMSDWSSDVCSSDLKQRTQRLVSLGGLLSFHVYAGAIGALLGIIHSGHKFQSPIGIALVIAMLTVVVTGFIGRYYLAQVGQELRFQQKELKVLRDRYDVLAAVSADLHGQNLVDPSGQIGRASCRERVCQYV